ncbi:Uncharacterised protein [Yersinia aleksiciae]|uniref:Uncharacterized protein n=1 Tax=Yersinia aleksiciae TaxID=263819 RepID=A0A0T9UYC2_YERAE|nr:Uncharacterised protein [Yersinia aleksiciae]CNL83895.1 Uncharacterised protein [Yersinia aleksiciae]
MKIFNYIFHDINVATLFNYQNNLAFSQAPQDK